MLQSDGSSETNTKYDGSKDKVVPPMLLDGHPALIYAFRVGNTRTTIHFCCQFADEHGFPIDHQLFEENSHYVRTALVSYNAVFSDNGDKPQKQYLKMIIRDGFEMD